MPHIEVDEMLGLVGDVRAEVTADNAMPCGVVLLVELLFNIGSNILLDIELLKGNVSAIYCVLLHLLVHVGMLDHCFSLSCGH